MKREPLTLESGEFFCDDPMSDEQKQEVLDYINTLTYECTYHVPEFPLLLLDWSCSKLEEMLAIVAWKEAEGGVVSWIGPDSTAEEEANHKTWRLGIRQRWLDERVNKR